MKLCVCRLALVMPCSTGRPTDRALVLAQLGVLGVELHPVHQLAHQEGGVAGFGDFHLLQHLADDHFDMLIVDLHALQPVDVLDFVHQVVGQRLDAQTRRMSCGTRGPSTSGSPLRT